jgi:hypothetical protein
VRFGFLFFEQFSIRFKAKNRFGLHLNHPTKGTKVIFQNEPIFSWFLGGDVFKGQAFSLFKTVSFGQADEDRGEFSD